MAKRGYILNARAVARTRAAVRRIEGVPIDMVGSPLDTDRDVRPRLHAMTVREVQDDVVVCVAWPAEEPVSPTISGSPSDATEIVVAKPWEMQRTPWAGQTILGRTYTYISNTVRRVTNGTDVWIEDATEAQVDEVILVCQAWLDVSYGGSPVYYIDTNQIGRRWRRKRYQLSLCPDQGCPSRFTVEGDFEAHVDKAVQIDGDPRWWFVQEWPLLV
jgi:hypothetical protein